MRSITIIGGMLIASVVAAAEPAPPVHQRDPLGKTTISKTGEPPTPAALFTEDGTVITNIAVRTLPDGSTEFTETLPDKRGTTVRVVTAGGDEVSVTHKHGDITTYTWDDHHRRIQVTFPNGQVATIAYQEVGDRIRLLAINGKVTVVDPRMRWEGRALVVPADGDQPERVIIGDPLVATEPTGPSL